MTGAPAPDPTESEPTPFPELVPGQEESAEVDVAAIQDKLNDLASIPLTPVDLSEESLYYYASTMAPLNPISAVSELPTDNFNGIPYYMVANQHLPFHRPPLPASAHTSRLPSPSGTRCPSASAPPS